MTLERVLIAGGRALAWCWPDSIHIMFTVRLELGEQWAEGYGETINNALKEALKVTSAWEDEK